MRYVSLLLLILVDAEHSDIVRAWREGEMRGEQGFRKRRGKCQARYPIFGLTVVRRCAARAFQVAFIRQTIGRLLNVFHGVFTLNAYSYCPRKHDFSKILVPSNTMRHPKVSATELATY